MRVRKSGRAMCTKTQKNSNREGGGRGECGFGERVQARVRYPSKGERERWKKLGGKERRRKVNEKKNILNGE